MSRISRPTRRPQVLFIADERGLVEEIGAELQHLGYRVHDIEAVAEGPDAIGGGEAVIFDRMKHGHDGPPIMEELRQEIVKAPVFVILALSAEQQFSGPIPNAGEYLVKPFTTAELAARVEALLARLEDLRATILRTNELEMDLIEQTVRRGEMVFDLSPREFRLLEYFLRRPGRLITRAMLLREVWHYHFTPKTNLVDVHLSKLRRKIDVAGKPSLITNIRGAGFMFDMEG